MGKLRSGLAAAAVALACAACALGEARESPRPRGGQSGTLPSGATWVADVPEEWNGTAVLYAHGYGELTARSAPDDETKDRLLAEGYALVGSSYSGPSLWPLETAADDQFAALDALERRIGPARRTIALGLSMGGLVAARQAEDPRGKIDGVLTTCGLVAGAVTVNDVQLDGEYALSRLLLPGRDVPLVRYRDDKQTKETTDLLQDAAVKAQKTPRGRARLALAAALLNLPTWSQDAEDPPGPRDHAAQQEHQFRILTEGRIGQFTDARRQIELAAGGNSSGNRGVDYRAVLLRSATADQVHHLYRRAGLDLAADLAALTRDASVEPDPKAVRNLLNTSTPTGALKVPVLGIHTTADDIVPVGHAHWYAARVTTAGHAPDLHQAFVRAPGHCAFQPQETIAALHALEHRLTTGTWSTATPESLNTAVKKTGGTPRYTPFTPPPLTRTPTP
ncbi:alpha/beta hydrolase [Actinocorallia sp. API 0066]|uniref:alpha/beta hydrolase n=1 Tax=Actinocorallia sp. API 0066 TaxID=2896846 RepID=UPI002715588C|nr:hypothetical protein [Actinocorallia sp. API 0066]